MKILGIETSCDETALALLEAEERNDGTYFKVLGNIVHSQIDIHKEFGGVVPMMAKREHAINLVPILLRLIQDSPLQFLGEGQGVRGKNNPQPPLLRGISEVSTLLSKDPILLEKLLAAPSLFSNPGIDAIAVTHGPGLEPALWVGISFAKALGLLWNVPVIPTNHMEGHIVASLIPPDMLHAPCFMLHDLSFPALALLISGGHTEFVLVESWQNYKIVGQTRDDAIGEAFDKVARLLELPYPGGPQISKLAEKDRQIRAQAKKWNVPRPMIHSKDLDFSFSGLKTSILYTIRDMDKTKNPDWKQELAREFEDAVVDVLGSKTKEALNKYTIGTLIVGGGVIANTRIREALRSVAEEYQIPALFPEHHLATDNALMIALAGFFNLNQAHPENFSAVGNLRFT